jgi:hypothetical protein
MDLSSLVAVSSGGTVSVGTPTLDTHAATKAYVDSLASGMVVGSTAPSTPENGDLWFDTLTSELMFYYSGSWMTMASIDDTLNLPSIFTIPQLMELVS